MNYMRKIIFSVMTVISLLAIVSCSKGDGYKDYGVEKVYIPQSMADGGITNVYNVPSGKGEYTYNFAIEENTVEVYLGVMRSGKQSGKAFSVDVVVNDETSAAMAAKYGAEVMEPGSYTLPEKVSVAEGTNSKTFHLSLDKAALKAQAGKKLVLCVGLANCTAYEINPKAAEVTVLVNVDALNL